MLNRSRTLNFQLCANSEPEGSRFITLPRAGSGRTHVAGVWVGLHEAGVGEVMSNGAFRFRGRGRCVSRLRSHATLTKRLLKNVRSYESIVTRLHGVTK